MNRNCFFAQLGIAFCIFLMFNGIILQRSQRLPSRTHILKLDRASRFEALFVGNSLVASGIDTDTFTQASGGRFGNPLNLGLNSSMSVEHLMLSRRAFRKVPHMKLFVYGCFFSLLTDHADYSKGLTGHQTLSYVLEPDISSRYYTHSLAEKSLFFSYSHVPYLMEQNTFWQKVEQLRRRLASFGVISEETNRMGRVNDFQNLVTSDRVKIKVTFEDVMAQDQGLSSQVSDLLKLARNHTDRVVVVNMPVRPDGRPPAPIWNAYKAYTRQKVEALGVEYIDASDWFTNLSLFEDVVHLTPQGATLFSRRLGTELAQMPNKAVAASLPPK